VQGLKSGRQEIAAVVLPSWGNLGLFVLASVALLLTPGPAVLYIVTRSITQGRVAGIVSMLGIQAATLVHVTAAVLGLSALLMSSALAFAVVKYVGAAYLIWLGLRAIFSRERAQAATVAPRSLARLFVDGIVVNLLNPKTALFFLAFLPQFVEPSKGSIGLQLLALGLIFTALAILSDGLFAILAGTAGAWIRRSRGFLQLERYITGSIFIGLGLTAALSGAGRK
jgi:threonine/homoserine/homoserine lactone efflux protein